MYVGRTNNFTKRSNAHANDPEKGKYEFQQEYSSEDYDTVRGFEQYLYNLHNPALNKILPIGPRNGNLAKYVEAAGKYLSELG